MLNLPLFFLGCRRISADADCREAFLNLCFSCGLSFSGITTDREGGVSLRTGLLSARRLTRAAKTAGVILRSEGEGLPFWLWRRRGRAGLLLGTIFAIALLILSERFVWAIRVTGNEHLSAGQIRQTLAAEGLEIGTYLPGLRMNEIETRVLLRSEELAWISLRMEGTVAVAQVIERIPEPQTHDRPANLVAACDGQIEGLELFRGQAMVSVGQPVRAGELLVSGVYDSATVGYRYTRAAGRVLARTERELTVEIPLSYEEKTYSGSPERRTTLQFFNFSIKFSKNSRKEESGCDIIDTILSGDRFGLPGVPVFLIRTTVSPYVTVPAQRTCEEALELAYAELSDRLSQLSADVRLLEKRIRPELTDFSVKLHCTLICVENIAVQTEFEVVAD